MLERALGSIVGQTLQDFILVIVNDSAEREPVDELVRTVGGDIADRVIVVHNESPQGRWGAMDAAIAAADSDYFILHDDDDTWHPRFLEETVRHLDTHPEDSAVAVRTELIFEEVADGSISEVSRQILASGLNTVSFLEILKQNYIPPIALLIRRSVFAAVGAFDRSLPVLADWDFTLRLVSRYTVGFIDGEPLAYWHHRETSTGDEGNSIVADAINHQRYNLRIRDRYLRESITAGYELGPLLLTGELFRQLDTKATDARGEQSRVIHLANEAHTEHIEVVHASLLSELDKARRDVESLTESVSLMAAELSELHAHMTAAPLHRRLIEGIGNRFRIRSRRLGD